MKLMIASDIHGSAKYCRLMLKRFEEEKADKLLLLGDLLYHGPRNDLPEEYDTKACASMLNEYGDRLLCVRGNCDGEVDQMVLKFPIMAEYAVLYNGKVTVYATHGHHFCEENPMPFAKGTVLACGHTHVPVFHKHDDYIYVNPGSVSIPKENSLHSYMILDGDRFIWKDVCSGNVWMEHSAGEKK